MVDYDTFQDRVKKLKDRIESACKTAGRRSESIEILPVTKTHPIAAATFAHQAGFRAVGENRVQEAMEKQALEACPADLQWELIGHLQSNKAKDAVQAFDRIQSVDSEKLLRRLDRYAGEWGKKLPILIQVNAGEDPQKYGITAKETPSFLQEALTSANLQVDGFMTIAPLDPDPEVARRCFFRLRDLRDQLEDQLEEAFPVLSMGMTDDLEAAIEAGSTQIRVGTALFGSRD